MFKDELKINKKIIKLFDKYSKKINIAIGTSSSKSVVKKTCKVKIEIILVESFFR